MFLRFVCMIIIVMTQSSSHAADTHGRYHRRGSTTEQGTARWARAPEGTAAYTTDDFIIARRRRIAQQQRRIAELSRERLQLQTMQQREYEKNLPFTFAQPQRS